MHLYTYTQQLHTRGIPTLKFLDSYAHDIYTRAIHRKVEKLT